jgi:hypothetical protein
MIQTQAERFVPVVCQRLQLMRSKVEKDGLSLTTNIIAIAFGHIATTTVMSEGRNTKMLQKKSNIIQTDSSNDSIPY